MCGSHAYTEVPLSYKKLLHLHNKYVAFALNHVANRPLHKKKYSLYTNIRLLLKSFIDEMQWCKT